MNRPKIVISLHEPSSSYKSYVVGFVLSLICTLSAYVLVVNNLVSKKWGLALIVSTLALMQFITQLTLFLHLGKETKPRLRLLVFSFMVGVVVILVGGSIWIMYNLNYHMLTPSQINNYVKKQDGGI